jgi:hypothetical protein
MIPLRPDSSLIDFYNDGLIVFLYDDANLEQLTAAGTDVFDDGMPDEPDEAFASLAHEGTVVAIELEQDDAPAIEVSVGPPLDATELARGRWWPPQRAAISLPSGTLMIEGYNNLRAASYVDPDDEPGGRVDLLPGEYLLTLYRIDWQALEQAGLGDDLESWGGPWHVITLTPHVAGDDPCEPRSVLWLPTTDEAS